MLSIFLRTLPFFLIIGLGYRAGRSGFFPEIGMWRVSSSILISATTAIVTVSLVIDRVNPLY